jgi:hypothetical protein
MTLGLNRLGVSAGLASEEGLVPRYPVDWDTP